MKKTRKIRDLFNKPGLIKIVGAHDGLSAKLVERSGFDGIWASSLEISTSYAVPDANILTMSQYLERACEMNDAVSIPVIADCDTGYGNSNNVIHMVKKYETAGIAGVCIEDKQFPKVNSYIPGRQDLTPISEFVGKIMAAKNAQESKDFMVIARVEALISGWGMEEALKRAHAYVDAGADTILIHSKSKAPDEIFEFARKWQNKAHLIVVPTSYHTVTSKELEDIGVKMVIYANHGIRAATRAIEEVLNEIQQKGTSSIIENKIASMKQIFELQGMSKMKETEEIYLRTGQEKVRAFIPAAGNHLEEHSMKDVSSEVPIAMLDINGRPLLQRQLEILNRSGISEVYVIGGYKKEKIDVEGVNLINNSDHETTGILHSIMCAQEYMVGKTFIAYSDILFDRFILDQLLQSEEDITILLDVTFDSKNYGPEKKVDLVITDSNPTKTRRKLRDVSAKEVRKIGLDIKSNEAHYEFPGLILLSSKGIKILKETYFKAANDYKGKPFHNAATFEKASLADLLQEIIDSGYKVKGIEVNAGWLEIHSFDNYKLACSTIK